MEKEEKLEMSRFLTVLVQKLSIIRMNQTPELRPKTIKFLEETLGGKLLDSRIW